MNATLPPTSARPLGQLLLRRGLIREEQLERALAEQRRGRHRRLLGEILIDLRDCTEQQVAEALAEAYGIPFARIGPRLADPRALGALPREFVEKHLALPLFLVDGVLTVAAAEPADLFMVEEAGRLSGRAVQVVAATAGDIRAALRALLPGDGATSPDAEAERLPAGAFRLASGPPPARGAGPATPTTPAAAPPDSGPDAPAAGLLDFCLWSAVKEGATAVHFETTADVLRVRFRIDGVLVEKLRRPPALHEPLARRLKAAAALDPGQCRLPQQGRVRGTADDKPVDFEVSTAPGRWGEQLAVRVLRLEKPAATLEKLGFGYDMLKQWRRLLSLPGGLLLVTGPDDSGKRTTLYSSLESRNAPGANLCAIEDVPGRPMPGVNQFALDPSSGFTADAALEAVLRQDPDVLMACDLPDPDSARRAARAALGGRLVLAGFQAGDTPLALAHLLGQGLEPYLVASSVAGVLAQRLVRKLCQGCRRPYEPTGSEKRQIEKILPGIKTLFRAAGCDRCRNLGYCGRVGLFELLVPDDGLIDALSRGGSLADLRRLARGAGMTTLRVDGFEKARAGVTTLEEVYRVTG